ncbi:MAG: methylated-DNA--[protein]-cysteine S-methyltransferase [Planctomycetia bacterium]
MSTSPPLAITTVDTPLGPLTLTASPDGLRGVGWEGESVGVVSDGGPYISGSESAADASPGMSILRAAVTQLDEYFRGWRTTFDLPLAPCGTPFQRAAWEILRTIPFGHTMTYGEQARRLGGANKARAVGAANGRNPLSLIVPCHRVIGADGSLTGFAAGVERKAWLLRHEAEIRGRADRR